MAILDNAIWLTGTNSTAQSGVTTISEGGNSTDVTGTFTGDAWDASQSGFNVSDFGAFGVTSPITADYQFSNPVENLSFTFDHVNGSGVTYDDQWTIYAYDQNGDLISSADVIAGLSGVQDDRITVMPDGSVRIDSQGTIANDINLSLPGKVSQLKLVFENGPEGTQSGGSGISDLNFTIPVAPDFIVEGSAGDDLIDASYLGDPEGDQIDNNDHSDGSNDDSVEAGDGADTVLSGAGHDTVDGGSGDDSIVGGAGNDSLLGDEGADTIDGGADSDTLRGGMGDDSLLGGSGNDSLYGDEDDDTLIGGAGNDTFEGGTGSDRIEGGIGDDSMNGDIGDDTLFGGAGDDFVRGSFGNDELHGGTGDDYLWGGFGDDTIHIENDFGNDTITAEGVDEVNGDTLDLSAVTDDLTINLSDVNPEVGSFTDGTSTATFEEIENIVLGSGTNTLVLGSFSGADVVSGFTAPTDAGGGAYSGNDQLDVSGMNDADGNPVNVQDVTVSDDGSGNAVLSFPNGESLTLLGVDPADVSSYAQLEALGIPGTDEVVSGTAGADLIDGSYADDPEGDRVDANDNSAGDNIDTIVAGAGNDTIVAGLGSDLVSGGADDDTIYTAQGDTVNAGTGDDTIIVQDLGEAGNDSIDIAGGIEGDTDWDVLDVSGLDVASRSKTVLPGSDDMSGTITLTDGTVINFTGIEQIICFTTGTLITTPRGPISIEDLKIGDLVMTRDNGLQPVRWIGSRTVPAMGALAPVRISAGALGNSRDLLVSPQHRMLIEGPEATLMFGTREVLASAKHLVNGGSIVQQTGGMVTYVHVMFEAHEVIYAEGAASESFYPGDMGLGAMDDAARAELFTLFPELRSAPASYGDSVRPLLRAYEADLLNIA